MRSRLFARLAVALAVVFAMVFSSGPAEARKVAKDPLNARVSKSKAATKSTGAGNKYLRVKNNSSQKKK